MFEKLNDVELRQELRNAFAQMEESRNENGVPRMGKEWYTEYYWPMHNEWVSRGHGYVF